MPRPCSFAPSSITGDRGQFEKACKRFARCVRPGGTLAAAFLVGSSRYVVAERPFPILDISEEDIVDVFAPVAQDLTTERIGIVEKRDSERLRRDGLHGGESPLVTSASRAETRLSRSKRNKYN